jgi:hypothetical protein
MTSRATSATLERSLGRVEGKLDGLADTLDQRFKNIEQRLDVYKELPAIVDRLDKDLTFYKRAGSAAIGLIGFILSSDFIMKSVYAFAPK